MILELRTICVTFVVRYGGIRRFLFYANVCSKMDDPLQGRAAQRFLQLQTHYAVTVLITKPLAIKNAFIPQFKHPQTYLSKMNRPQILNTLLIDIEFKMFIPYLYFLFNSYYSNRYLQPIHNFPIYGMMKMMDLPWISMDLPMKNEDFQLQASSTRSESHQRSPV